MQKSRPRSAPLQRSRSRLSREDTAQTAASFEEAVERPPRQHGERVEAPSAELRGQPATDWGKVGVWLTVGLAAVAALWHYAENVNLDVSDLKRKSDDLIKSSADAAARLSALERRTATEPTSAPQRQPSGTSTPKQ
jgi:hypothetical protein